VKAEEKLRLDVAEAKIQRLKDERTVTEARQTKLVEDLKAQLGRLTQENAVLSKEKDALTARLARAEAQADRFQQDNARLAEGIQALSAKPGKKRQIDSQ
jgi:regulator of replication initiation timing